MNWKSMMIATGVLFAASAGLMACGDDGEDDPCETNQDCVEGEFCVGPEGARECEVLCESDDQCPEGEACFEVEDPDLEGGGVTVCDPEDLLETDCFEDTDCTGDQLCVSGFCQSPDECVEDTDCGEGQICETGFCIAEPTDTACETTGDCLPDTAYCAVTSGGGSQCLDVSCGSDLNSCGRCQLGPSRDDNGPVIFFPEQAGTCEQNPNLCEPGAAPWACRFSFLAFDPDDNLPTSGLNKRINVISSTGSRLTVFGTSQSEAGNNRSYTFTACFPETSTGNIGTAVVLSDNVGDDSQTLCVDGSLPL